MGRRPEEVRPLGQTAAAGSGKPAASGAAATLPDGVVPVAKLWDVVQADAKAVTGKKVQIEGTYWGLTKETSEGKVTYSLEIVASKSEPSGGAGCDHARGGPSFG